MIVTISFQLPAEIEEHLRRDLGDLDQAAKEAVLVEMYRQKKVTHHELAAALGLSRFAADALLKKHDVNYDLSVEEILRESASIATDS